MVCHLNIKYHECFEMNVSYIEAVVDGILMSLIYDCKNYFEYTYIQISKNLLLSACILIKIKSKK